MINIYLYVSTLIVNERNHEEVKNDKWLKEKQNLCARSVDMNLPNGWGNVLAAEHGIKWWKRLKR